MVSLDPIVRFRDRKLNSIFTLMRGRKNSMPGVTMKKEAEFIAVFNRSTPNPIRKSGLDPFFGIFFLNTSFGQNFIFLAPQKGINMIQIVAFPQNASVHIPNDRKLA